MQKKKKKKKTNTETIHTKANPGINQFFVFEKYPYIKKKNVV